MNPAPALRATEAKVLEVQRGTLAFNDALTEVVRYQRAHIPALAAFWTGRGFTGDPEHPEDIPPVPTDVYRRVRLTSGEATPVTVFRTSGTTAGARGEAWRLSTRAYDEGAALHFKRLVLPDRDAIAFEALVFDPTEVPDSSLSHMVEDLHRRFGKGPITYRLHRDAFHVEPAAVRLRALEDPVLLFGTAFGLVHLLDAIDGTLALPEGSRVVETGGFKGRSRTVERGTFYAALRDTFALPRTHVLSEYSMTELSSQLYTAHLDTQPSALLRAPAWCHVIIRDPVTLQPLPAGDAGLVSFVDLANVDVPCAVLTSDVGRLVDGDLELHGRAGGATPRGCSLAVEELLALTGDA